MSDNLNKIEELFDCVYDPKYADGYTYLCKDCKKVCNVSEAEFRCKDGKIIPTFIVCRYGCGKKWKLKIYIPENLNNLLH